MSPCAAVVVRDPDDDVVAVGVGGHGGAVLVARCVGVHDDVGGAGAGIARRGGVVRARATVAVRQAADDRELDVEVAAGHAAVVAVELVAEEVGDAVLDGQHVNAAAQSLLACRGRVAVERDDGLVLVARRRGQTGDERLVQGVFDLGNAAGDDLPSLVNCQLAVFSRLVQSAAAGLGRNILAEGQDELAGFLVENRASSKTCSRRLACAVGARR